MVNVVSLYSLYSNINDGCLTIVSNPRCVYLRFCAHILELIHFGRCSYRVTSKLKFPVVKVKKNMYSQYATHVRSVAMKMRKEGQKTHILLHLRRYP